MGDVHKGYVIDHSNRNGLSNSRQNLRFVTFSQNAHNIALRGGTSMYRGVSWSQITAKWHARVGGQHFGYFDDEEEASRAADKGALLLYGEVAQLNGEYSDEDILELQQEGSHITTKRELPIGVVQRGKKFLAQITINKQYTNLGMFDSAQEAHIAYLQKINQETGRMLEIHNSRPIVRNDEGVAVIDIHDRDGQVIEQALVDDEDWHQLTLTSWSLSDGYVVGFVNGQMCSMHSIVLPETDDLQLDRIDHMHHVRHDNRKEHLRRTTASGNAQNKAKREGCASRFIGVTRNRSAWSATISADNVKRHLGIFETEERAALAYNLAAVSLYDMPMLNDITAAFIDLDAVFIDRGPKIARENQAKQRNAASKYKWVCKSGNSWQAEVTKGGNKRRSRNFDSEEAAAIEANKFALELFGEGVILNDVTEDQVPETVQSTTSTFTGVSFHKKAGKWMSQITIKKKHNFLGYFDFEVEAAQAYNARLRQAFADKDVKSLVRLNDVPEPAAPAEPVIPVTTEGTDQKPRGGSSKFKGVSWSKSNKKWVIDFPVPDKPRVREGFASEVDAARRYNELAILHRENPRLNVIPDDS